MEGIAIIGMSGRFPGAGNVDAFWQNLVAGVESISRFTEDELELPPPPDAGSAFVNARGIVENADLFDAALSSAATRVKPNCSILSTASFSSNALGKLLKALDTTPNVIPV